MSDSEQAVPVRVKPNAMGVKKKGRKKSARFPKTPATSAKNACANRAGYARNSPAAKKCGG